MIFSLNNEKHFISMYAFEVRKEEYIMKNVNIFIKMLIVAILIITFSLIVPLSSSHALDSQEDVKIVKTSFWEDIFSKGDKWTDKGNVMVDEEKVEDTSTDIFNIVFYIGMALALIIGMILGIQFMMASTEDKAKIKEALIPYCVGCAVIFGAFGIWKIAITVLNNLS